MKYVGSLEYLSDGLRMRAAQSCDYAHRLVASSVTLKPHLQPRTQHDKTVFVHFDQYRIGRRRCFILIVAACDLDYRACRCENI